MARDPFGLVGTTIDRRYQLGAVVGEGGFGVVYRARHLAFERDVAIKCLKIPSHFDDAARATFLERFREEGRVLSRLAEHPGVVKVFDFGVVPARGDDVPYLALEWLDGAPLEEVLRARRARGEGLELGVAFEIFLRAVEAVAFAHEQRIAHRDIKPANLFLVRAREGVAVKVLDFGIAKAVQEGEASVTSRSATTSGLSAFSPLYGAPEQFSSKRYGTTGTWTDVHALGLVFVEMVSGRPPLPGDDFGDLFLAATSAERPTPRSAGVAVPDALEGVLARALALHPKDRFADAGALLAALRAVEATVPPSERVALELASGLASELPYADTEMATPPATPGPSAPAPRTTTQPSAGGPEGSRGRRLAALGLAALGATAVGSYLLRAPQEPQALVRPSSSSPSEPAHTSEPAQAAGAPSASTSPASPVLAQVTASVGPNKAALPVEVATGKPAQAPVVAQARPKPQPRATAGGAEIGAANEPPPVPEPALRDGAPIRKKFPDMAQNGPPVQRNKD